MTSRGASAPIPWEDRPAGESGLLWRSTRNPIIARDQLPRSNSIFNSAVVPFEDGVRRRLPGRRHGAHDERPRGSQPRTASRWEIDHDPIALRRRRRPRVPEIQERFEHAYDPRVTWLEDRFYVTWCNGYHGPTIGVAYTTTSRRSHQLDNAFLPFNRNGVLFPRRIGGRLRDAQPAERQRPHAVRRHLLLGEPRPRPLGPPPPRDGAAAPGPGTSTKVGAGPTPIETDEGWLVIYHGVLTSCNGFVYSMGAALLDLDEPWRVLARPRDYLLAPQMPYEQVGDVPNVVFPCAALVDRDVDRITDLLRRGRHRHVHRPRPPVGAAGVPTRRGLSGARPARRSARAALGRCRRGGPQPGRTPCDRATKRPIRSSASSSFS